MTDAAIDVLLAMIDQAYGRRSWHGTNLRGSIRGVSAREAAWRPSPRRHNVWELAVHAAYWKYAARRRITGERRGSFPLAGSNWLRRPGDPGGAPAERAWKADVALLEEMHRALRAAVERLEPRDLGRKPAGSAVAIADLVIGVAFHDVYHAGQIQLLKRLSRQSAGRERKAPRRRR
jgi:hypothetical protein